MRSASIRRPGQLADLGGVKNGSTRTLRCTRIAARSSLRRSADHPLGELAQRVRRPRRGRGRAGRSSRGRAPGRPTGVSSGHARPPPRPSRPTCGPPCRARTPRPGPRRAALASWATVSSPIAGEPLADPGTHAPQRGGRAVAHHVQPVVAVQEEGALRLAEVGRDLGADEGVADADRAVQPGRASTAAWIAGRSASRVVGLDADEGLVPAEHLHDGAREVPQRRASPRADAAS